jgi:hypothetical protein
MNASACRWGFIYKTGPSALRFKKDFFSFMQMKLYGKKKSSRVAM